ncbi:unnamed protein product [Parascedosporium putredinis]|uniref:Uncharacterized protein n=1 Tax=Parascedosporium putredinis TaxID=1442378 RepID=A0A9P1M7E0_9PEZI|nr:unnamed protein product [Parascedosporium putredinis]CAI7988242.1 unnamed protein product [Parascedosporium putredinis]
MRSQAQLLLVLLVNLSLTTAYSSADHPQNECTPIIEEAVPATQVLTFTIVVTVAPTITDWGQVLESICPTAPDGPLMDALGRPVDREQMIVYPDQLGAPLSDSPALWESKWAYTESARTASSSSGSTSSMSATESVSSAPTTPTNLPISSSTFSSEAATSSDSSTSEGPISSSITLDTSLSTTETTQTPTETPQPECEDLVNGDFTNVVLAPWYLSDEVVAYDSAVLPYEPSNSGYAFALIPYTTGPSQVYLNQLLPSCGQPPPEVTVRFRFSYSFAAGADIYGSLSPIVLTKRPG